jgi:nucleotide-binding universal stress UspA family protein
MDSYGDAGTDDDAGRRVIHVAVDGSPGSHRAVEWALGEADVRHCTVELVTAYQSDASGSADAAHSRAEQTLSATVGSVVAGHEAAHQVSWHAVLGDPVDVLVRASAHSALLVMGSHRTDGLLHSALGSVADSCARMADCPVVIIPPVRRPMTDTSSDLRPRVAVGVQP